MTRINGTPLVLASKAPVTQRLAIVDGLTRSGKKLTCRILSALEGIDYVQYHSVVEKLVMCHAEGLMSSAVAVPLLQTIVDEYIYNRAIGRNLNTRPSDETCIYKSFEIAEYIRRIAAPDGPAAMEAFNASGRIQLYYTHFALGGCAVLFDAFPYVQMINITRNPVDLAEDWLRRGWGSRTGVDPLAFGLLADAGGERVPWFAADWATHYLDLSPAECCIESILHLQERTERGYVALPAAARSRILRVAFESLVTRTGECTDVFAAFLQVRPHRTMAALHVAENCPRRLDPAVRQRNLAILAKSTRPEIMERLVAASSAYDQALVATTGFAG